VIASTLIPAVLLVGLIYFLVIRLIRWRWLSYGLVIASAAGCISSGTVHLVYVGIEVGALGCFLTWWDPMRYWRRCAVKQIEETDGGR